MARRPILRFVVLLCALYGVAMLCSPLLRIPYAAWFRTSSRWFFGHPGNHGIVGFTAVEAPHDVWVRASHRLIRDPSGQLIAQSIKVDSVDFGYSLVALTLALILATPVDRRRRTHALLWGFLLVNGYVVFKTGVLVAYLYNRNPDMGIYAVSAEWRPALNTFFEHIISPTTPNHIVPVLIWLLVTFRARDWDRLLPTART